MYIHGTCTHTCRNKLNLFFFPLNLRTNHHPAQPHGLPLFPPLARVHYSQTEQHDEGDIDTKYKHGTRIFKEIRHVFLDNCTVVHVIKTFLLYV